MVYLLTLLIKLFGNFISRKLELVLNRYDSEQSLSFIALKWIYLVRGSILDAQGLKTF